MEAEDVLVLSRKYTERLMQGAGDPAIVQNVTQIANITPNGKVHEIDFSDLVSGHKIIAPATGWMYAEAVARQGKTPMLISMLQKVLLILQTLQAIIIQH